MPHQIVCTKILISHLFVAPQKLSTPILLCTHIYYLNSIIRLTRYSDNHKKQKLGYYNFLFLFILRFILKGQLSVSHAGSLSFASFFYLVVTLHSAPLSNPKTLALYVSTPVMYLLHYLGIGHVSLPPVFSSQLLLCLLAFNYFEKTHKLKLGV